MRHQCAHFYISIAINLSRRDALIELDGMVAEDNGDEGERKPKRDRQGFKKRG